jgi:hypothetical protein
MAVLYRVNFKAAQEDKIGDWFQAQGLNAAMDRVRNRMKKWDGPYQQRDRGEEWGQERPFEEAADRYRQALINNEVGDIRIIRPQSPEDALILTRKVHIIDVDYPSVSSNATSNVDRFIKPCWDAFPQLEYWGCYNCRRIAGSSSWSEHAWADALDLHPFTMTYGDQVYRWCMNNRGRFNITRVLWRVANHYDHLHVDFDPDHSGYPPCA